MKNIKQLSVIAIVTICTIACSTNIPMSTSLDDELVYDLEVNDSIPIVFKLENQLTSGSFFQYEKGDGNVLYPVEDEMVYNEYVVLTQMLNDFMRYRFANTSGSEPAQIDMGLKWVTISSEATENDQATTLNSLLFIHGTRLYTAEVRVEVIITHKGQTHKRTIYGRANTRAETFKKTKTDVNAYSAVLNKANNRVVYFTNQFLRDVGL